jgi:alginate O-acetyltransferase complex protein AlgJ
MARFDDLASCGQTRRAVLRGFGAAALTALSIVPSRGFEVVHGTIIGKDRWLFPLWDDPRHAEFANITSSTGFINRTVRVLREAGIETLIALTPAKGRTYRDFLPPDLGFTADGEIRYRFALDALTQAGTLAPDLATLMQDVRKANPSSVLFFKADTHWTAEGAECAAQEVARVISAAVQLPPPARPGMALGPVTTRLRARNDLADAIGQPAAYPLQSYRVHPPVVSRGGAGLTADDGADVAVVGSSYMAPEHNFAPMLSNRLRRPVTLVWRTYDVGPYHTLLLYLRSPAFRQIRPRLIVWNFHEVGIKAGPELLDAWTEYAIGRSAFIAEVRKAIMPA